MSFIITMFAESLALGSAGELHQALHHGLGLRVAQELGVDEGVAQDDVLRSPEGLRSQTAPFMPTATSYS